MLLALQIGHPVTRHPKSGHLRTRQNRPTEAPAGETV